MNKVLFSSVSKKFVMALAGLFLLLFLPVHLIINLMLLKSDPEPFNNAAHFMASFPLIKIIEIVLICSYPDTCRMGSLPSDPELALQTGRLCKRQQVRNFVLFKVHDLDRCF